VGVRRDAARRSVQIITNLQIMNRWFNVGVGRDAVRNSVHTTISLQTMNRDLNIRSRRRHQEVSSDNHK
jgi:hypothetical protein